MTAAQIAALPIQTSSRLIKASDTGVTYHVAKGDNGNAATKFPISGDELQALIELDPEAFRSASGLPAFFAASDHGAVGNGIVDDGPALRAMLTAAFESDAEEIIFDLGSNRTYWLGTNSEVVTVTGLAQTTGLFVSDTTRRKLIEFRGQGVALLKNGTDQAHHILVNAPFDQLRFRGVHFLREHPADLDQLGPSNEAYAQGVVIYPYDNEFLDLIHFSGCFFTDCHRGYSIYRNSGVVDSDFSLKNIRGKLRHVLVEDCVWTYPRGSNHDGTGSGGQAEYVTCWAALSTIRRCSCDGAVGGDVSLVPSSGLPKDGFLFGSPLRRVVRDCEINHISFEAISSTVDRALAYSGIAFSMPAVGAALVTDNSLLSVQVDVGDFILRDNAGWFEVTSVVGTVVTAINAGDRHGISNAAPGAAIGSNGFWKDDFDARSCVLDVQDSRFPETTVLTSIPDSAFAAYPCIAGYGLRVVAVNNDGPDCMWGVYASCEYHDRFATFGDGTNIARNRFRLVDHDDHLTRDNVIGIFVKDIKDPVVEDNRIDNEVGYDFTGIHAAGVRGTGIIRGNTVSADYDYVGAVKPDSTGFIVSNATDGDVLLGSTLLLENIDINCVVSTDVTNNGDSLSGLTRNHLSIKTPDPDTLDFIRRSAAADIIGLDAVIKGIKAADLWDLIVCWPLAADQNSAGATVHSFGGLGVFPATQDGTLPSTTAAGRVITNSGQTLCAEGLIPVGPDGALLVVVDFAATGSEARVISYDTPATSHGLGIDKYPATQFRRLSTAFDAGWGTQSTDPTILAVGGGSSTFRAQDGTLIGAPATDLTDGGSDVSIIGRRYQGAALGTYAFAAYYNGALSPSQYTALRTVLKATVCSGLGLP